MRGDFTDEARRFEDIDKTAQARAEAEMATEHGLGTTWVAPGKGSTWRELAQAFDNLPDVYRNLLEMQIYNDYSCQVISWQRQVWGTSRVYPIVHRRTNLLLTGQPLAPDDFARWQSGQVK